MKTSCFSISAPLIRENFRRFWALPAVAFLAYFICGILPILTNYKKLDTMASLIHAMLNQSYICYLVLTLLVPVIASSLVFRYLHKPSSATVMHALPFTRSSLFNTNLISGFILSVLPVLASGAVLLCLAKPVHYMQEQESLSYTFFSTTADTNLSGNLFSHQQVLIWIAESLLLVFCIYALSIFAGALTGNAIIHFFSAIWFNILGVAFMEVLTRYFEIFLYGYRVSDDFSNFMATLSPLTGVPASTGHLPPTLVLSYVFVSLGLMVLSAWLYKKRRMERTQRAFVFRIMEPLICYLITFFGMTLASLALYQENGSHVPMYAGIIGGSIIAFIIGEMIIKKSLRIFSLISLKNFGIYAMAAALFICLLAFDMTGYAARIPKTSQIEKVTLMDYTLGSKDGRFQSQYYKSSSGNTSGTVTYKTEENIEALRELHQSIIDTHPAENFGDTDSYDLTLKYYNKGTDLERNYLLSRDFFKTSASYKTLFESKEFKSFYSLNNLKGKQKPSISLSSQFTYEDINIKDSLQSQLLDCLEKDFQNRTYEQQMDQVRPYGSVFLQFKAKPGAEDSVPDGLLLNILQSDSNTKNWLKKHGYDMYFAPKPEEIDSVSISRFDMQHFDGAADAYADVNPSDGLGEASCYSSTATVTGKAQIQQILNTCEEEAGPYECVINFKKDSRFYKQTPNFYFSAATLPEFLKDRLK